MRFASPRPSLANYVTSHKHRRPPPPPAVHRLHHPRVHQNHFLDMFHLVIETNSQEFPTRDSVGLLENLLFATKPSSSAKTFLSELTLVEPAYVGLNAFFEAGSYGRFPSARSARTRTKCPPALYPLLL